jgi:hypothetical protein
MQWCSIDPGCTNFSLSSQDLKTTFHVNFVKFIFFLKFLKLIILSIVQQIEKMTNQNNFVFIVEKQLEKTSNMKFESHLCKCCKQLNIRLILIPAYLKNQICFENYNFFYKKFKTKAEFKNLIMSNETLNNKLKNWTIYTLDFNFDKTFPKTKLTLENRLDATKYCCQQEKLKENYNIESSTSQQSDRDIKYAPRDDDDDKNLDSSQSGKGINTEDFFSDTIRKNFTIKKLINLFDLKKFDDLIDTRLLLDARHTVKL